MRFLSRLLCLLGALALVSGCDYFPASLLEADAGAPEASVDRGVEGGQRLDGPLPDGPLLDGPLPDGPLPDGQRLDGPLPDGPLPDGPLPDTLLPDAPLSDGPVQPPCASGATKGQTYAANMVVCGGSAQVNQCSAAPLCNTAGGWSMCTASQFLARGGKTTVTVKRAWLAACIRNNSTPTAPTNAICSSCMGTNLSAGGVGWRCTGSKSDTKSNAYIGVASFFECRRVGVNTTAVEGDWHPFASAGVVDSAVCCR